MSDIEEDIKNIEQYINLVLDKGYCDCNELNVISTGKYCDGSKNVAYSMQNILAERKQDKERIQELEAKLEFKKWGDLDNTQFEEYMNQFILKQNVKDKIEENNIIMINMQNRHPDIYVLSDEWRNAKAQNKVLQGLLEDK